MGDQCLKGMELLFEITKKFQEWAGVLVTRIVRFKVAKTENFILYYFTIKKKFQLKKKVRDQVEEGKQD